MNNIGQFRNLSRFFGKKDVKISTGIIIKCKENHKISDPEKFIAKAIENHEFIAPYENDKRNINVYYRWTNKNNSEKYMAIGINKATGNVATVFVISQSKYNEAKEKAI